MASEADRMARAGNYVLGLMNEAERERAERDLERDALFRDAVLSVAEQMRVVSTPMMKTGRADRWRSISEGLADLPQMRGTVPVAGTEASGPETAPNLAIAPVRGPIAWRGMLAAWQSRNVVIAACVIAAFAAGYLAGVSSPGFFTAGPTLTAGTGGNP